MKILIVSHSDIYGGAGKAALRLFLGMLKSGLDVHMLVLMRGTDHSKVFSPLSKTERVLSFYYSKFEELSINRYKARKRVKFSTTSPSLAIEKHVNRLQPDIVNLHWANDGMLSIEGLAKIQAPVVWSLHDMWSFTGGCHYDQECGKFVKNCGDCPILNSGKENDLSRKVWSRKQKHWSSKKELTIIGLSNWLAETARTSSLFRDRRVEFIPNGIDTDLYRPVDQRFAREAFNLPLDKKLIMFGAMSGTGDPRKGFSHLVSALDQLANPEQIGLVVLGTSQEIQGLPAGFSVYYPGKLTDDVSLSILNAAVDVVVSPSEQENLSNSIMEALSCGTPVVAFRIGGNSDMITHQLNGYLAQPFDATEMAQGIDWVLNTKKVSDIRIDSRESVTNRFMDIDIASKHLTLYEELLGVQHAPLSVATQ